MKSVYRVLICLLITIFIQGADAFAASIAERVIEAQQTVEGAYAALGEAIEQENEEMILEAMDLIELAEAELAEAQAAANVIQKEVEEAIRESVLFYSQKELEKKLDDSFKEIADALK